MSLYDKIKKAVKEYMDGIEMPAMFTADVITINPLSIRISDRLIVEEQFFIITERVTAYQIDLSHTHTYSGGDTGSSLDDLDIRTGLEVGNTVLLQKIQGGQFYAIIDKVVSL